MPKRQVLSAKPTRDIPQKGMSFGQITKPGMGNYPKSYDNKANAFRNPTPMREPEVFVMPSPKPTPKVAPKPMQQRPVPQPQRVIPTQPVKRYEIEDFYRDNLPPSQRNDPNYKLEDYYPVAKYFPKMREVEKKYDREGLAALLALQAFFETTGGRNAHQNNMFGTKPFGVPNGFRDLGESIDYQVSQNVLGGGAVPAMNILNKKGALTPEEIETLYVAYDPPGAYKENILKNYRKMRGL